MITCKLGEKTYTVEFVTGRALREIGDAAEMFAKISRAADALAKGENPSDDDKNIKTADAMDVMVQWFCLMFKNQFTPEEVYDNYPVDRLMHDIAYALMAVQNHTTTVLSDFPMKAVQTTTRKKV